MTIENNIASITHFLSLTEAQATEFSRLVTSHPEYPSIISYYEAMKHLDYEVDVWKISENNAALFSYPALILLRDDSYKCCLSYVTTENNSYHYYTDGKLKPISHESLKSLWLGYAFVLTDNATEIEPVDDPTENHIEQIQGKIEGRVVGMRNQLTTADPDKIHRLALDIVGNDNVIEIGENVRLRSSRIKIYGNNHRLQIDDDCRISGQFDLEGDGSQIHVKTQTTMEFATLSATESKKIVIGKDCMFSEDIIVFTSDSHSIIDLNSGERINSAQDVFIDDHVWLAKSVTVLKGVQIGANSIVGIGSIVTKNIPENSIAVGNPAKVIKTGVTWSRDLI